jgi:hypothetical protein
MLSAYLGNDKKLTNDLMQSYSADNEEDPAFMPGVIFGCMLHLGVLLATIAESSSMTIEEAFSHYASSYNLEMREQMSMIPTLHQGVARQLFEVLREENL